MDNFISEYSEKLREIYQQFINYGIMSNDDLDFSIILRDLYDINKFLNITYFIFSNENTTDGEKAIKLAKLKDSYDNNLLTLDQAIKVVEIYKIPITRFFKKLYNRKLNIISASQRSGVKNNTAYKNHIDNQIRISTNKILQSQGGGSGLPKVPIYLKYQLILMK